MHIPNNDITSATSQNNIWHPIANKLYFLNCWQYAVVNKKFHSQLMIFVSFSIRRIQLPAHTMPPLSHLTSCTPTKSNLYLTNFLATVKWTWPDQYWFPYSMYQTSHSFASLRLQQGICPGPRHMYLFCNKASFYGEELLALRPTPQTGRPPHVSCPWLLIQYFHSYPPY